MNDCGYTPNSDLPKALHPTHLLRLCLYDVLSTLQMMAANEGASLFFTTMLPVSWLCGYLRPYKGKEGIKRWAKTVEWYGNLSIFFSRKDLGRHFYSLRPQFSSLRLWSFLFPISLKIRKEGKIFFLPMFCSGQNRALLQPRNSYAGFWDCW